jgi:hypothetical protein
MITCLARAGQRNGSWLFVLCRDRIPWLDPDDIDPAKLIPDKAQTLGRKIGLTAAMRPRSIMDLLRPMPTLH